MGLHLRVLLIHMYFHSRESLTETIISDLANYRHKRVMGLAGMFGDHLLSSN